MRFVLAGLLTFALLAGGFGQVVQKPAPAGQDEKELRRLEDEWLGSYVRGDKATFDRIVADDFTGTDESAKVRNKAQERELIQAPPASVKSSLTNEDIRVRIYGDAAIVTAALWLRLSLAVRQKSSFSHALQTLFSKGRNNGR